MVTSLHFNQIPRALAGDVLALQFVHKLPAIMLRFSKRLLTIAALSCAAMPCFASAPAQTELPASCKPPEYPLNAVKRAETGISKLGFLLRPDGTVARSVVVNSSRSATLDNAARDALSEFVLQSAAELGHAAAQFDVGVRYERGNGVPADPEEALRWYRKSAAQGDLFATQRLALGRLWY